MDKESLKILKDNPDIKYIYKIPSYWYTEKCLYIVISKEMPQILGDNVFYFSTAQWFEMMTNGSPLVFACGRLKKRFKIKEYLSIYQKPDNLLIRKYLSTRVKGTIGLLEADYGFQLIKYGQIFNFEGPGKYTLSNIEQAYTDLLKDIYIITDSAYKDSLIKSNNE